MEIQTKRNEIITVTSNVEEMIGKYLAEPLNRSWKEDFIDEDNGEVISIERFEPIYRRGQMIGPDEGAVISFHLQTGDVKEVKVSNQCREGKLSEDGILTPWIITVALAKSKVKLLLYARGITQALEIAADYAEINYKEVFTIVSAKCYNSCFFILTPEEEKRKDPEKLTEIYFFITASVHFEGESWGNNSFMVEASDVDAAKIKIADFVRRRIEVNPDRTNEEKSTLCASLTISLTSAKPVKIARVIPEEYAEAYNENRAEKEL